MVGARVGKEHGQFTTDNSAQRVHHREERQKEEKEEQNKNSVT